MSTDQWDYHPENQIREIVTMPGGEQMERMYFPKAVYPVYSYRKIQVEEAEA